jgi:Fe-S-cluster containining protein
MAPFEFEAVREAIESGGLGAVVRENLAASDAGPTVEADGRRMPVSPCPLLENDRCLVYAARPISCRTQFAMNDSACRRAYEAARSGDAHATYQRAGDPAVIGIAAREAVQPARRVFLRDALRDYLG